MGFPLHFLILSLLLISCGTPAAAASIGCRGCHQVHFSERGSCVSCHRGNDRTDRMLIAHDGIIPGRFAWFSISGAEPVRRGKKLLETLACRRCHTAGGKGNRVAANLDGLSQRRPLEIAAAIQSPVMNMPPFRLPAEQTAELVNAILAGSAPRTASEAPQVVHFEEEASRENSFEKFCGACHRAMTARKGGLGKGVIGPNLSGLFSPFYPATFRNNERWSEANLKKWLTNPRRVKNSTTMQPVPLSGKDFAGLVDMLNDNGYRR